MNTIQATKPIEGLTYYFHGRFSERHQARYEALNFQGCVDHKHAYYCRVQEKGVVYFDVRVSK